MKKAVPCHACSGNGFTTVFSYAEDGTCNGCGSRVCDTCRGEGSLFVDMTEYDQIMQMDIDELALYLYYFLHDSNKPSSVAETKDFLTAAVKSGEFRFRPPREDAVVDATYITEWENGARFSYPCKVNMRTREIFDIGPIDPDEIADYNYLLGEFVRFEDGREYYAIGSDRRDHRDDDFWYSNDADGPHGGEVSV